MGSAAGTAPAAIDAAHADAPAEILASWEANAGAWTASVRGARIESRRVATDAAIVDAVRALAPARVLDVGCGEGWLARALAAHGIRTVGIDGSAALVDAARRAGGADVRVCSYAALAAEPLAHGRFDAAVCNFSLFERDLAALLRALGALLRAHGALLIQTVHPDAQPDGGGGDGWREESFATLGEGYRAAMPWYFRTAASWRRALAAANFDDVRERAVVHPDSGAALSLILNARRGDGC